MKSTKKKKMDIIHDPKFPGSFSSAIKIKKGLATVGQSTTLRKIKEWIMSEDAYTLHRPIRRKFNRRKIYSAHINDLWQVDLVDMSKLKRYNKQNKFILTCIDVFSKKANALAIKNKSGLEVKKVFQKL